MQSLIMEDSSNGLFRVHRSALMSEEVLALERERIFARSWLYLGHESEVENPGDYRRRVVAGRPLFFARGDDGQVRVFYNTCPHRGALVCRRDEGNAKVLQCFYHAWTFNIQGELISMPEEEGYPSGFDKKERSLKSPPRVESYRGLIFISFNPDAPPLAEYLGSAREFIDLIFDQFELDGGPRILRGSTRYHIKANWKLLVENSIDGYHAMPTHQTYFEFVTSLGGRPFAPSGSRAYDLGNGHAAIEYSPPWGRPVALWHPLFGEEAKEEIEDIRRGLAQRYGEERAARICERSRNLLIYPNLIINDVMALTVRTFYPVRPDYMEVVAWEVAGRDEHGERLRRRTDNFLTFLGPGGLATPDDVEALESCQAGFSAGGEEWNDISRGTQRAAVVTDERQMRAFWRKWWYDLSGQGGLPEPEVDPIGAVHGR
jgi:p-cumate 2,3-dioxygenase alpha subunit